MVAVGMDVDKSCIRRDLSGRVMPMRGRRQGAEHPDEQQYALAEAGLGQALVFSWPIRLLGASQPSNL